MTLPLAGHPVGVRKKEDAKDPEELIQSAYRFLLADLMPFGKRAVIRLEHGGTNQSTEHYQSVSYWYGLPAASLVLTDELNVGDTQNELSHKYASPDASEPYELESRYEWGPDHIRVAGKTPRNPARSSEETIEVYPSHREIGRTTKTYSQFTLRLRPDNRGVLLRRTLDYQYPNQRARVLVADAAAAEPEWRDAGVWYLAGSNTCYHSYPRKAGELGKSAPVVQTSNRRFRDDEFLVPMELTRGRSAIRIRIEFTPVAIPLLPGRDVAALAWSEIRYRAYCYVLPDYSGPKRSVRFAWPRRK